MEITYEQALRIAEELRSEKLKEAELSSQITSEQHELAVLQAKIERGLIRKVGGEKQLAPTMEDRERIFTVARAADEEHERRWQSLHEKKRLQAQAKIEISALSEKLRIMLEALRSQQQQRNEGA